MPTARHPLILPVVDILRGYECDVWPYLLRQLLCSCPCCRLRLVEHDPDVTVNARPYLRLAHKAVEALPVKVGVL